HNFGYFLPMAMREEVGYMLKGVSDKKHKELSPEEIFDLFDNEYINVFDDIDVTDAIFHKTSNFKESGRMIAEIDVDILGESYHLKGEGNGRLDAVSNALRHSPYNIAKYNFVTYQEQALESESDSRAAAYVAISDDKGWVYWGVGLHDDIIAASINALVSALNRFNKISHFVK
ncbi:MAG: 2-isopropylmalate synthase, partial [Firmicutes bacterium]|nr:2-isopropylmalate synthase [Bacillota bacterium]